MSALLSLALVLQEADLAKVREFEAKVRAACDKAKPAYVFFGQGSGVCISADGWVLTNYHVAGDRDGQRVRLTGGRSFVADVVGWDPKGDISLCKLKDAKDLPYCELGDSDALRPGQSVIAVGNPFMLGNGNWEPTITLGIVSALHRYMDNPGYFDAIQTDAQINPGNSGGPLLTLDAKVVGINGRIDIKRFMNRVNTGIGYAIPSNQIRRYLEAFKRGGRVFEGFIDGIKFGECGDARYANVGEYGDGVFIETIKEETPAARAGFQLNDIVLQVENYRIYNSNRFHGALANWPQGEWVRVKVLRKGETKELRVFLGEPEGICRREMTAWPFVTGMTAGTDESFAKVEVLLIEREGPAREAEMKPGDVIAKVDGATTPTWADFAKAMSGRKAGDEVKLVVVRDKKEVELVLKLAPKPERPPRRP
jgi:serine protease Do